MTTRNASASAVTRVLSGAGMTKSERYKVRIGYHATRGFRTENVTQWDPDKRRRVSTGVVFVSWVSGNFARLPGDVERELQELTRATEILTAQGYAVQVRTSAGGYVSLEVTRPAAVPTQTQA